MSLQANWKRWTVVSIGVIGAIPACWLLWLMISTHGIHVLHLVRGDPPPGAEIIVPKPPLSGDDAFARLEAIALRLHKPASEPWLGAKCHKKSRRDPECMAILQRHLDQLKPFDDWAASNTQYGLERPSDLGPHTRAPLLLDVHAKGPYYPSIVTIGRLLEARAVKRLSSGDAAGAERDLRTLFALADFLQQNPSLLGLMVGKSIQDMGLTAIVWHWQSSSPSASLDKMLALHERLVDGFRMAIGDNWLRIRHTIQNDVSPAGAVSAFVGLYDEDDTLRLVSKAHRLGLALTETTTWAKEPSPLEECETFNQSKPFPQSIGRPNMIGRMTACIAALDWHQYANRVAYTRDAAEATRVVMAARRYRKDKNAWPTKESELTPTYLKAWPVSLRTGEPLSWLDKRQGVQLTGWPCGDSTARAVCEFHFSPPQAMAKEATERR